MPNSNGRIQGQRYKYGNREYKSCEQNLDRLEIIFFLKFPEVMKERSMEQDAGAFLLMGYRSELRDLLVPFISNQDMAYFFAELEILK